MIDEPAAQRRKYAVQFVAIFLVALALRLLFVGLSVRGTPADVDGYGLIAGNLAAGHGYALAAGRPTAYRPPLYPLLIAAIKLLGGNAVTVIWLQSILQATVVLMVIYLTRSIVGELFAVAAGAFAATDPYLIYVCGQLMTECFFTFVVAGSVTLAVWAIRASKPWKYAIAGLVGGAAAVTRPEFYVFLPGVLAAAAYWGPRRRKALCLAAFALTAALLPTAWAARNSRVMGRWIFTTTHGGYTHRLAYNEVFYNEVVAGYSSIWSSDSLKDWQAKLDEQTAGLDEIASDAYHYKAAAEFTSADPMRAAKIGFFEAVRFWSVTPHSATGAARSALGVFFVVLGGLAIVGAYVTARSRPAVFLVVFILAAETLVHTYFWSDVRMRIPFHPLLAVLAGVGLATLFGRKIPVMQPIRTTTDDTLYSPAM